MFRCRQCQQWGLYNGPQPDSRSPSFRNGDIETSHASQSPPPRSTFKPWLRDQRPRVVAGQSTIAGTTKRANRKWRHQFGLRFANILHGKKLENLSVIGGNVFRVVLLTACKKKLIEIHLQKRSNQAWIVECFNLYIVWGGGN